ncbi:hypothetical protein D3C84_1270850 [compost metagenome]
MALLLESIHGADDTVVHLPLAGFIDEKILAIDLEVFNLELVIQLFLPLLGQACGGDQQDAFD